MIHIVTVRIGKKYDANYSAILHDMADRNMSTIDRTHWEITDDPGGLLEGVNAITPAAELPGWWQKVYLFSDKMPWPKGDRVLYLDLDVAITGRLEDIEKGIIQDWGWPSFNSSVMCWDAGEHSDIWTKFDPARIEKPGPLIGSELLPKGQVNGGDQEWITEIAPDFPVFPLGMFASYRWTAGAKDWPPLNAKAVVFHGDPKPHEITSGWVPNVWKMGGFTSLPVLTGVNVSDDVLVQNIAASCARPELQWFEPGGRHSGVSVLVCGGPSMKSRLAEIRRHKARGAKIFTVNNALKYLVERGITPDAHIMLDARPENAEFVKDAPRGVLYLIASQCHPDVFDALANRTVILWQNMMDSEGMTDVLAQYALSRPIHPVPGGGTVGLRALKIIFMTGCAKIHVYGLDSSLDDAGEHHAYPQALNDGEDTITVMYDGKAFKATTWMARQADEFQEHWKHLNRLGVSMWVHGDALIPTIAKSLRKEMAA